MSPRHIGTEPPANTRADVPADVRADVGGDTASDPEADRTEPRRGRPVWTLQILGRPALLLNRHSSVTDEPATDEPAIPDTSVHTSMPDAGDMVDVSDRVSARMFDLLVYLALHPEGARRDAVVAALWPDTGRPRPSNNLSALINRLRNALQAALNDSTHNASDHNDSDHNDTAAPGTGEVTALVVADGERYRLDTDRVAIDYHTYLAAVALATSEPGGDATHAGPGPAGETGPERAAGPAPRPGPVPRPAGRQASTTPGSPRSARPPAATCSPSPPGWSAITSPPTRPRPWPFWKSPATSNQPAKASTATSWPSSFGSGTMKQRPPHSSYSKHNWPTSTNPWTRRRSRSPITLPSDREHRSSRTKSLSRPARSATRATTDPTVCCQSERPRVGGQ